MDQRIDLTQLIAHGRFALISVARVINPLEEAFSIAAAVCPEKVVGAPELLDSLRCQMEHLRCEIAKLLGEPLRRRPTLIQSGRATIVSLTTTNDVRLDHKRLVELRQILMPIERDIRQVLAWLETMDENA